MQLRISKSDLRIEGILSEVEMIRSDDGEEFNEEKIRKLCDAYNRAATVANPENRPSDETLYGYIPWTSPIPFLSPVNCTGAFLSKPCQISLARE